MAIKWSGWTANPVVKAVSFILIPLLVITSMYTCYLMFGDDDFDPALLFAEVSGDGHYFYQQKMQNLIYAAHLLSVYQSTENIRGENLLYWEWVTDEIIEDGGNRVRSGNYYLKDPLGDTWGPTHSTDPSLPRTAELIQEAVRYQLQQYQWASERFAQAHQDGLLYYIENENFSLINTLNRDFFLSQPVYQVLDVDGTLTESHLGLSSRFYQLPQNIDIYLAYSQEAVDQCNMVWIQRQVDMYWQVGFLIVQLLLLLATGIVFLCGVGRRAETGKEAVYYTVLDKPYLDIGGIAVFIFFAALFQFVNWMAWAVLDMERVRSFMTLNILLSLGITLPLLWWGGSFVKRWKDGGWWRHTLCYHIVSLVVGFFRSLWTSLGFFVKTALVLGVCFLCALITYYAPPMVLVTVPVLTYAALRFAKRLHLIKTGAALAAAGIYDPPIPVQNGELGEIAGSINQVSAGIDMAVKERLKSERMKTELITNVSHDIRTPLTSLITYTDLLQNEGLTSEKAPEYLEVLVQKSHRLKTLMDELLEASKAATGNVEVHLEELDLGALIQQCLGELDEKVRASQLDFRLSLPPHAWVMADGKLIWRVMENLLGNVFKYALPQSRVYIDVLEEKDSWRLDIKNISASPLNMDPAELTERFTRGDSARAGEGSGLGLSIVQSFVEVQGGKFVLGIDGDLFKATVYLPKAL